MKALIQRVDSANVKVDHQTVGKIERGYLILLGVESEDNEHIAHKLAEKVLKYRIFCDQQGKMNLNIAQVSGQILVVSQFTLVADTSRGNRPGFSKGASPDLGEHLYECFLQHLETLYQKPESGEFGADMKVALVNDGPVTFLLETRA